MNLPNRLTLARICLIPFIIFIPLVPFFNNVVLFGDVKLNTQFTLENLIVLIIFVVGAFTDFLDGYIARKHHLITDFGKFMDPLADKLLVLAALIVLLERGRMEAFGFSLGFVVTLILAREFMVTGIRLIAASDHLVIAASKLGKFKTISQMALIIILLLNGYPFTLLGSLAQDIVSLTLIVLAGGLTIISGVDYFWKNKDIILKNK
ncbi:MAG TPA: CDP-diacylglycerol--glycerol-3-phosphate 3-phosphatidyltransferase [Bacilli bacterium]|nr:MAG: CDP-diacylglycerol--glycerol-3-phosphate 3-phosphatidyltransferase [Tenericutes bacterium ADurb.BinA124]HOH18220.1 CDP-diacylglycerol--glycerol-3-phosphate 3-phosphatidyltransferase [Bacilli bacterium]HPN60645.1 CDP-diacylglycerol--glycerol-3-phosphate 3-phosphatidyltransferase [Bacilli bacterium]HPX83737.1 CDP-diacylglycerol--glycerol-3-phosphate 3-phosphatidyltransferase [Bacilli bacterium]HQC74179.1 CDP-diacylglycerol--glycerol-3-phosphate 3-phosphatidyltransferase [Bacilli bacterium